VTKSKIIILLGFGSILLLVSLLIIIGVSHLNSSKASLDRIVNYNNLKIHLAKKMHQFARERTISLQHMLIVENEADLKKSRERMAFYGGKFVDTRDKLLALDLSDREEEILDEQADLSQKVAPIQNEIADLVQFNEMAKAKELLISKAVTLQEDVFNVLSQLQDLQRAETKLAINNNKENYNRLVGIMWIVSTVVIFVCISIVYFTLKLITKNEKQQEYYRQDIERQAFYDHLTGLPNRRLLNDRIQSAIKRTERHHVLMAVLFIDCDRFKPINDTLGHVIGDELLISISNRLSENVRDSDTVCRFSGDEFAIILEDIEHIDDVNRVAQNILESISSPHYLSGHKVFTTVSIGITVYPIDDKDMNSLLSSADIAMYHAKQNGGNQFEYFNSEMNKRSKQRLTLEHDLHEALDKNELEIYYQPLNRINTTRDIIGVEALLRWHHPTQGIVSPVDFISIAEDSGLIISIGDWVLTQACKQVIQWEQQGLGKIRVSINLSPRQFAHTSLITAVQDAIDTSGIDPEQIDLEITESTAMHAIDKTITILHQLKKLGVHISIDDFGTGYSSLSYLQQMPIDNLKIDRSFIKNLHNSDKDKAFVQAIVTMAHTLGLKIVAEGVEHEEQLAFLEKINCEIAQGFMFSKPVPHHKLAALLNNN